MAKSEGPRVTITLSCADCVHERSESYRVQGDSGHDVSCAHPASPPPARVGDTTWATPLWCPLRSQALARARRVVP